MSKKKGKLPPVTDQEFNEIYDEVMKEVREDIDRDWEENKDKIKLSDYEEELLNAETDEERQKVFRKYGVETITIN